MDYHELSVTEIKNTFFSDLENGLNEKQVILNREKFGKNVLTKQKDKNLFLRILDSLKEPMMLILIFSFILAFGVAIGKYFKTGEKDFTESLGILIAISVSTLITLIMEGSSKKAFLVLNKIYDNIYVKVIRSGTVTLIHQKELVKGDIVLLESGDKIVADGRLFYSDLLSVDESALTGESISSKKNHLVVLPKDVTLAERTNMVYSGTFVTSGTGKMIVTGVGDETEIGKIAGELKKNDVKDSPLQLKLNKLGKIITLIGVSVAVLTFILSLVRCINNSQLTFSKVQDFFVSAIILIVAAVPEGLPTIVAVSLALNMIKLSKENALIKKMIATETAGAVSVICTDKTGTLTQNKMKVLDVFYADKSCEKENPFNNVILQNFVLNTTCNIVYNNKTEYIGSGTECALLDYYVSKYKKPLYEEFRNAFDLLDRIPFSSDRKMMSSTIKYEDKKRELIKGAPEIVLSLCDLTEAKKRFYMENIEREMSKARRVLCFAHKDKEEVLFDGYVVMADAIRPEVKGAIKSCKKAGIDVKVLTGDNFVTAYAVSEELDITHSKQEVILANDIENLSDEALKKILPKIKVIARSTPFIKLRVVTLLKELGEVVAVTGDGINDAPAIKKADVGISMGITGSEITKESADVILLDDSFNTIVKCISFGRNVYRNLQRFIIFQLSVNLSALLFVTLSSFLGYSAPFNTLQLLWINVIMDGPPALTLGLESASEKLMTFKPVKKDRSIITLKMLLRILFNGIYMASIMIIQYKYNFLGVLEEERSGTVFTLFILFQLFNAFNCKKLGAESIFKDFTKNKVMLYTFLCTFIIHIIIVELGNKLFMISSLRFCVWFRCLCLAFSVVLISEIYKLIYRFIKRKKLVN